MQPDKITIEITADARKTQVLAGDTVIATIEMVRDPATGYLRRTAEAALWENSLLDLTETCPQVVDLYDLLFHGESELFPELQDALQWIAEKQ